MIVVIQPGLRVRILPREAQVVGEVALAVGVSVGRVGPERVGVVPTPTEGVVGVDDLPGGVQVVAEDGVGVAACVDDGDGQVAQPDVFVLAVAVGVVFADQVPGLVVGVGLPACAVIWAGFADALDLQIPNVG